MRAWDFLVDRANLSRFELREADDPTAIGPAEGEAVVAVERFSLTANNITYGVVGDRLGYWRFFPAPDGWGRIPVWGFGRVVASRADGVAEGTRLYGYWPMSTHLAATLRPQGSGFVDEAAHRAGLPAAYNRYEAAPETPHDDHLALLRPLFTTSFLLDDWLAEVAPGATAVLSSASSRTAIGLAFMLARRGNPAVALTSARNAAFVDGLGLYARTLRYDEVEGAAIDGPAAFIDMAGDPGVRAAVHAHFGDRLAVSAVVGSTHHGARATGPEALPGPAPTFFFAPDRLAARRADWGAAVLGERIGDATTRFIDASGWLRIERHHGPDALARIYEAVRSGAAGSDVGHIVLPG